MGDERGEEGETSAVEHARGVTVSILPQRDLDHLARSRSGVTVGRKKIWWGEDGAVLALYWEEEAVAY